MVGETQLPGIGWGGEFWLDNDVAVPVLTELKQVKSFTLPQDEVERVETTHLKSAGRRREYAPGMIEGGEFEVTLNYRAGSDTDILLAKALADGKTRKFKAVIPERGVPVWQITGNGVVTAYDRGEVNVDDAMESTVTVKVSGLPVEAVWAAALGYEPVVQPEDAAKEAEAEADKAAKAAKKAA